jgi:Flp pilus assembly protein TadG
MVEFTLVLPMLLLILLGAVDFGRVFFTYIDVNNAAREGAAYAALDPNNTNAITTHAQQETNAQAKTQEGGSVSLQVTVACSDASTGLTRTCQQAALAVSGTDYHVTVTVTEQFQFFTPFIGTFFGNPFTLTASTTAPVFGALQPSS